MIKVHGTIEFPPPGYTSRTIRQVSVGNPSTGTIEAAFEYVDAHPASNKYYDYNAEVFNAGECKCFARLNSNDIGRFAYYYNDTWNYGEGYCMTT